MKILYLLALCASLVYCINNRYVQDTLNAEMEKEHINEHDQLQFKNWMLEYGKSYDNDFTAIHRLNIFMKNKKNIERHNQIGSRSKARLNEFSDQDYDELAYKMFMHIEINDDLGYANDMFFTKKDIKQLRNHPILSEMREKALKGDGIDWSKKVPGPKAQGTCGSCWAFSSSDVSISRLALKGKEDLTQLSKTHLIDCCVGDKNKGCNGGSPVNAYKFINDNGTLKESEYREYDGTQQECTKPEGKIGKGEFADFQKLDDPTFEQIKDALQDGPVVALMQADKSWFDYSSGIIDTCSYVGQKENSHAVVFVGYTHDYYIVKNSWGTGWGEGGFFQVQRNGPAECTDKIKRISFPVVA